MMYMAAGKIKQIIDPIVAPVTARTNSTKCRKENMIVLSLKNIYNLKNYKIAQVLFWMY